MRKVAKWDGQHWSALGQGVTGGGAVTLAVYDDGAGPALYLGGTLTEVDGVPVTGVARWNGQSWSAVGYGWMNMQDQLLLRLRVLYDGSGPKLYAFGDGICHRWDGETWTRYEPFPGALALFSGPVRAGEMFDSGDGPQPHVIGSINLADYPEPNRFTNIARFTPAAAGGPACGDFDNDGDTDQTDLGVLLANYGQPCP